MPHSPKDLPRIFLGLSECSGFLTRLCEGLRHLGVPSVFLDMRPHRFQYCRQRLYRHGLLRLASWIAVHHMSVSRRDRLCHILWFIWSQLIQIVVLIWAARRLDIFVFYNRSTFVWGMLDLPLLKALGKRIIHVFAGSETRPPYLDCAPMPIDNVRSIRKAIARCRRQKKAIRWLEQYADELVSFPLYSHYHERPFIDNTWIGFPMPRFDSDATPPPRSLSNNSIRIVHAPSDPIAKGTRLIREAVQKLIDRGFPIQYVEISGRPNAEVLREFARCDFVVDQVFSDAPVTAVAAEAAQFAKATIVAGYASNEFINLFGNGRQPPTYNCHPDALEDAILDLIVNPALRQSIGRAAFEFVGTRWQPVEVARRFMRVVRGSVPKEWYFDPNKIRYLHGFGLPESVVKQRVCAIVNYGGKDALELADKPELERLFLDMISFRP